MMLDTADYVVPPNEFNSIFIMTNFIKTEQMRSECEEVNLSKMKKKMKKKDALRYSF